MRRCRRIAQLSNRFEICSLVQKYLLHETWPMANLKTFQVYNASALRRRTENSSPYVILIVCVDRASFSSSSLASRRLMNILSSLILSVGCVARNLALIYISLNERDKQATHQSKKAGLHPQHKKVSRESASPTM